MAEGSSSLERFMFLARRSAQPASRPPCAAGMPPSSAAASNRPAPAATRGQRHVDVTIRWWTWARTFALREPVTPASIVQQLPALENCIGFSADGPVRGPGILPLALPRNWPIPRDTDLWVEAAADPNLHGLHYVYIAGPEAYYFILLNVDETPEEALWPIGYLLSGVGHSTTWWERRMGVWGPVARQLDNHIPLALQFIGQGSWLHWSFEVHARVETSRHGEGWLPFDLYTAGQLRLTTDLPDAALAELELANMTPELRTGSESHWLPTPSASSARPRSHTRSARPCRDAGPAVVCEADTAAGGSGRHEVCRPLPRRGEKRHAEGSARTASPPSRSARSPKH